MKPIGFAVLLVAVSLIDICLASVLPQVSYQGLLTDPVGNPVSDGVYSVKFSIYDVGTGGNELWSTFSGGFSPIQTRNGLFTHSLGSTNPLPDSLSEFDSLWLSITILPDSELQPRTLLTSVFAALRANFADSALSAGFANYAALADTAVHAVYSDTSLYSIQVGGISRVSGANGISTQSQTWSEVGSFWIPPNSVREYIHVLLLMQASAFSGGGYEPAEAFYDIRIGLPTQEVSVDQRLFCRQGATQGTYVDNSHTNTITYYYQPTGGEISQGFNVKVFMRITGDHPSTTASLVRGDVFGR